MAMLRHFPLLAFGQIEIRLARNALCPHKVIVQSPHSGQDRYERYSTSAKSSMTG